MTMLEAVREVLAGVRPGLRGTGCAVIYTATGQEWGLVDEDYPLLVDRLWTEGGKLCREIRHPHKVTDEVVTVEWGTDESGAIKGSPGD